MEQSTEHRNRNIGIRVTDDEWKLFDIIARQQRISKSEFLRNAGIHFAELSAEDQQTFASSGSTTSGKPDFIREQFTSANEIIANTIREAVSELTLEIKDIEKLLKVILYTYLFHTPEVPEGLKRDAKKSAIARMDKIVRNVLENFDNTFSPSNPR